MSSIDQHSLIITTTEVDSCELKAATDNGNNNNKKNNTETIAAKNIIWNSKSVDSLSPIKDAFPTESSNSLSCDYIEPNSEYGLISCTDVTSETTTEKKATSPSTVINNRSLDMPNMDLESLSNNMSRSFSSENSSCSLTSDIPPPTNLKNNLISIRSTNENSINSLNDVFDDDAEYDLNATVKTQHERRRSSKRAMSSSTDECSKVKTRMCLSGSKCPSCTKPEDMSNTQDMKNRDDTASTLLKLKKTLNTAQFEKKNPFDYQVSFFLNYKYVPSLKHCKLLSNDEVTFFLLNSFNKKLPDVEQMFPWLHGIHKANYGQISFLSNNLNSSLHSKPKVITFEKPASLDENNYLDGDYSDDDDDDGSSDEELNDDGTDHISKITKTPNTRFLVPIRSCNTNGEISPNFSNIINESVGLIKGSISADDILISYSNIINIEVYLQEVLPSEVFKFYHPETIITDCIITKLVPVFRNMDPEIGINLRNFHIQVSKISNISDFIVYCFNNQDHRLNMNQNSEEGDDAFINNKCKCLNLSRLLHIAQIVYQNQHPEILKKCNKDELLNNKKYNTFILDKPNVKDLERFNLLSIPLMNEDSSIKKDDELCCKYDIQVFNNWDSNYLYRERLEISKMSTATPLPGNLWLGNITDYECLQIQLNNSKNIKVASKNDILHLLNNQKSNSLYCQPENTIVRLTKADFEGKLNYEESDRLLITFPSIVWKFYIKCVEGAKIPTLDQLRLIYDNYKDCDFINIEFPPSGSVSLADMSDEEILSIINICKFCFFMITDKFPGLIYCSDGYTESSLLALCYLMYSEDICLDEAILKLHVNYGRPFFIFKTDYTLLTKLETIMKKFSPLNPLREEETSTNFKFEDNTKSLRSLLLLIPKGKNSVGQVGNTSHFNNRYGTGSNSTSFVTNTGRHVVQLRGGQNRSMGSSNSMFSGNSVQMNSYNNILGKHLQNSNIFRPKPQIDGCFQDVHGSLPSRILNHLYLGSLTHATNIPLLSRLGIDYIISVGEKISWSELFKHEKISKIGGCETLKYKKGQYDENSGYLLNVEKMMILNNINDDGIGTLISTIDKTLEFIEECYQKKKKVLVHCQVGVSRSATVCIAEVMKRLKLSLPRAYMYVRVRRLNVIIQPNLKLMYELFKWEENHLLQNVKNKKILMLGDSSNKSINLRNDSVSSTVSMTSASTTFTNTIINGNNITNNSSKRSSISTARGNSVSSYSGNEIFYGKPIERISEMAERGTSVILESENEENEEKMEVDDDPLFVETTEYDVISNSKDCLREVEWSVLCREIYNLNKAYIKSG